LLKPFPGIMLLAVICLNILQQWLLDILKARYDYNAEQLMEILRSGDVKLISTHEHLSLPVIERIYKKC